MIAFLILEFNLNEELAGLLQSVSPVPQIPEKEGAGRV
jgi:hypothetical protein